LPPGLGHADRLIEGLVASRAVDDQIGALAPRRVHHRGHRIGLAAVDGDIGSELTADPEARLPGTGEKDPRRP
jgi:hypothetical protein